MEKKSINEILFVVGIVLLTMSSGRAWGREKWDINHGELLPIGIHSFNPSAGVIRFKTAYEGYVRIRVGLYKGQYIETVANMEYFKSGDHCLRFDPQFIRVYPSDEYVISALGIQFNPALGQVVEEMQPVLLLDPGTWIGQAPSLESIIDHIEMKPREFNQDCILDIWMDGKRVRSDEVNEMAGTIILRADLPENHRRAFQQEGFKTLVYINNMKMEEFWDGCLPFTCELDTRSFSGKRVLLSVNLQGYYHRMAGRTVILNVSEGTGVVSGEISRVAVEKEILE